VHFTAPLYSGILIKRYKRFLADVRLENGKVITAHCPNSGSMKSCKTPGWQVLLSDSGNPKRRYPYTWEMVHNGTCWIGINTGMPNKIVYEAIAENRIPELSGYSSIRKEVPYGRNSRIDLLLEEGTEICYVEVKNVSLVEEDGCYYFPDAVTARGRKHLQELMACVRQGQRAVMFFVIQRSDGSVFKPAAHIDPAYAETLIKARLTGVELLACRADVSPEQITLAEKVNMVV
jgi:sugar fermentation stimulation protein A